VISIPVSNNRIVLNGDSLVQPLDHSTPSRSANRRQRSVRTRSW
jgi:hypothetical protein